MENKKTTFVDYLLRVLALPFLIIKFLLFFIKEIMIHSVNFIRFGGEWITYTGTVNRKTIFDVYETLIDKTPQQELQQEPPVGRWPIQKAGTSPHHTIITLTQYGNKYTVEVPYSDLGTAQLAQEFINLARAAGHPAIDEFIVEE